MKAVKQKPFNVLVRKASASDIPAIVGLEKAAVRAAHWKEAQYSSAFDTSSPSRLLLVAETSTENKHICGFAVARIAGDEAEIENVVVAEAFLRQGIGMGLITALMERFRQQGAKNILLEVRASNSSAIALYLKAGFQQDGVRKDYYSGPAEDALLFSRSLKISS